MTEEEYQEIKHAGAVMCRFCEADHCTNCQVTELLDDAYNEAVDAGLITEDEGGNKKWNLTKIQ